jgi:hypothetical protein
MDERERRGLGANIDALESVRKEYDGPKFREGSKASSDGGRESDDDLQSDFWGRFHAWALHGQEVVEAKRRNAGSRIEGIEEQMREVYCHRSAQGDARPRQIDEHDRS